MPPDQQPPPRGRPSGPAKSGRTTLVGGLPWQAAPATPATPIPETAPSSPADVPVAAPPAVGGGFVLPGAPTDADGVGDDPSVFAFDDRGKASPRSAVAATRSRRPVAPSTRAGWLDDVLGAEEAAEFRSIPARIRAWADGFVRRSPPFTVSLSVHVVVLIVLALLFVRLDRKRRRPIDLSFASTHVVEAEKPGVQVIEPAPEPEPEPEPEVMDEKPPVEEPLSAPKVEESETVEALGSEPTPAAAPAVGSLLDGREAGQRERLVAAYGGSDATEAAVAKALEWLVRQQGKDGLWSLQGPYLDGATQENRLAATAMALLALQGAGNTPRVGTHKKAVDAAWAALLKKQVAGQVASDVERRASGTGRFEISLQDPPARQALYAHAQVTIALCELYGMTHDPAYERPAQQAVAYAVAAQGPNGGWRYDPGRPGDMSVTGWYMMALKSAQMAGLEVPRATFANLEKFLDTVAVEGGSRYGYLFDEVSRPMDGVDRKLLQRAASPVTAATSAEGLLCRQYLGWPRAHPMLAAGVEALMGDDALDWENNKDVYAWYYLTQVLHHLGGPPWARWNARMKEVLPAEQVDTGNERGSWDPAGDKWKTNGGRLFETCFCTYMLEVYYRHLPLYGEEAVAGVQ